MKKRYLVGLFAVLIVGYMAVKAILPTSHGFTETKDYHNPSFYGIHYDKNDGAAMDENSHSRFWGIPDLSTKKVNE